MAEMRSVAVSDELCRAIGQKFARRFDSVDELISELLRQLLRDDARNMDEKEQQVIEDRLKGLGYI